MSKIRKWDKWIRTITHQVYGVMGSRYIYNETSDIITSNDELPKESSFYTALRSWYADSILLGVRRQVKGGKQSISLRGLLEDIKDNPEHINREYWVGLWKGNVAEEFADSIFDRNAAVRATHIDPVAVAQDLAELRSVLRVCETFVDKRIAHYDQGPEPKPPTFGELDAALETLDRLVKKYFKLITADELKIHHSCPSGQLEGSIRSSLDLGPAGLTVSTRCWA